MNKKTSEFDRVLSNPENFLISDSIADQIDFEKNDRPKILIGEKFFVSKIVSVLREESKVLIKLDCPDVSFKDFINSSSAFFIQGEDKKKCELVSINENDDNYLVISLTTA